MLCIINVRSQLSGSSAYRQNSCKSKLLDKFKIICDESVLIKISCCIDTSVSALHMNYFVNFLSVGLLAYVKVFFDRLYIMFPSTYRKNVSD